ncbi:MAG: threonylcarbamoyl-AMP synthase, partial [Clostridia bacterium]|nr:threonylcarbamoyl-AMP synthase [Clostridia bacterium]
DDDNVDVIFAEDIDDKGINLAVSNRLYKAAGYKFIDI